MALISEKNLEEIRLANDIVDVIGSYFPLKKAGTNFRALCPFHKEKTPSFNVNPQRQIFKCFGCGEGGNVFHFIMKYENVDFVTAAKLLAERAGIRIEVADRPREGGTGAQKDLLYRLHDEVCSFYQNQLAREESAKVARDYLAKRGVSAEMVKLFRIGYAPNSWEATLKWAQSRKYRPELLDLAGLTIRREESAGRYDRFRGRLMFPICNEQGKVVGFSGRVLDPDAKEAKYVNSPETPIFNKGRILFGLDKTKRAIVEAKHAVICEGQLDMIACYQAGIENVVAPQGTAFTEAHGRMLKRHADEVVLCFDSDAAGQNAAVRSIDALIEAELIVRVAEIPKGHDPDSLIRAEGVEAVRAVLGRARSYFDYHLDWLCRQHDRTSDRGKVAISRATAELLAKVPNAALQATYLQKAATSLGVREDALREELRKIKSGQRGARETDRETTEQETLLKSIPPAERMLLQLMMAETTVVEQCAAELDRSDLGRNVAADTIREILDLHASGRWDSPKVLLEGERRPEQIQLITELLMADAPQQDSKKLAADCLWHIKKTQMQAKIEELRSQQGKPGLAFETALALQREILDLHKRMQHIATLPTSK